ncbi:hypothetical protein HYZ97_05110 [Candidatus Pacearchaeota archaeon]|nr:hypothetical protein [Candidatus Pacearchaeota archaeon]
MKKYAYSLLLTGILVQLGCSTTSPGSIMESKVQQKTEENAAQEREKTGIEKIVYGIRTMFDGAARLLVPIYGPWRDYQEEKRKS